MIADDQSVSEIGVSNFLCLWSKVDRTWIPDLFLLD